MKLHLGCGPRFIEGYVHVDAVPHDHVDVVSTIDKLPFIQDETVDVIYNCHVLEHFQRSVAVDVLTEWARVLKPGGVIRTAVPDFAALCELYTETKDLGLVIGSLFGRQNYLYNFHYNVYDLASITADLEAAGFADVRRYDWRQTDHAEVDDYSQAYIPHMDKDNGKLISLNVEATKPN